MRNIPKKLLSLIALAIAPLALRVATDLDPGTNGAYQAFGLLIASIAATVVMFLPGLGVLVILLNAKPEFRNRPALGIGVVIGSAGALWWAVFWLWFLLAPLAMAIAGLAYVAALLLVVVSTADIARMTARLSALFLVPVGATLLAGGIFFSQGGLVTPVDTATQRLVPTTDNAFQLEWVVRVREGSDLRAPVFGWEPSERPPVQAAFSRLSR